MAALVNETVAQPAANPFQTLARQASVEETTPPETITKHETSSQKEPLHESLVKRVNSQSVGFSRSEFST